MRRALVTGATGFVGRHCPAELASRGYEVHAVTSREVAPGAESESESESESGAAGVEWHRANLLEPGAARALIGRVRPTHLLHLAWYAEPGKFWTSPENFRWVAASLELFEAFADAGGRRVVAAGTCAEYEWGGAGACVEGETPLRPATLYGACKHGLRVMLEAFAAQRGLSAAWGRVFFLYGPHEHPARLVSSVTRALLRGEPARCTHGRQVRDFLHAEDVGRAFVALLDSGAEGAVNVASGEPVALKEVVGALGELTGRPGLVELGAVEAPAGEPPVLVADAARLRREVGWSPRRDLRAGLAETVEWWRGRASL
ncbi:MAG TPA: NAD(P)-dependent oxidoreductase [Pyrinomonadaceae bacterium]|jgi:nucleoside-diphosphate-sugar epimerase